MVRQNQLGSPTEHAAAGECLLILRSPCSPFPAIVRAYTVITWDPARTMGGLIRLGAAGRYGAHAPRCWIGWPRGVSEGRVIALRLPGCVTLRGLESRWACRRSSIWHLEFAEMGRSVGLLEHRSRLTVDEDEIPRRLLACCAGYDMQRNPVDVIIVPSTRRPPISSFDRPPQLTRTAAASGNALRDAVWSLCSVFVLLCCYEACVMRLREELLADDLLSPLRRIAPPIASYSHDDATTICSAHHHNHAPATQIVPTASNGIDAVNFRQMNESTSLQFEKQSSLKGVAGSGVPGSPGLGGEDGLDPAPKPPIVDEFSAFSSITLHYDGES